MKHHAPALGAAALAMTLLGSAAQGAETSLINPPFSWGYYGSGLGPSKIWVTDYLTPAGATGASIQTVNVPIYAKVSGHDADASGRCAGGVSCEQVGTMQFQYALWKGYQGSPLSGGRVGAAIMGGFQLTDAADTNGQFSFLQMYDDASTPGGYVDGGGYFGKFNGMIPRWSANPTGPGWNYGANAYQYQLWDVPFDFVGGSPLENVTFETALVNYTALSVNVMADFTWSFDTLTGALTGQQIAIQGAASSNLLTLYTSWFPGVSYTNGVLAPATVPEPVAWASMIFGLGAVGVSLRRRRSARRNSYV